MSSKAELRSINEELQIVIRELRSKLEGISRAHGDIQSLMAAADVGILLLDNELRIKRFTPRVTEFFDCVSGDEGRPITDFTHSLDYEAFPDEAREVLRNLTSSERKLSSRNGAWCLMRLRPYRTAENSIDGIVVTFVDISERRRAENTLREHEAIRLRPGNGDRLTSMAQKVTALAHELNQPLSAAANYMEATQRLLDAFPECPPQVHEALDHAASQMLRAGRIVSRLHDFIPRGDPEMIAQSLHTIIRRTCEFASPLLTERKVALNLHLEADRDSVLADEMQIRQVLVNLIRNACEGMVASKIRRLTIATTLKDETLRIDVIDTGVGLTKAVGADFFESPASSRSDGLGVGLSISRAIVEAHQGKIWACPDVGGGARFSFTLPVAEMAAVEK